MEFIRDNLESIIFINVIISFAWVSVKKRNAKSKKDYWEYHKKQLLMWTPTVLLSMFLALDSVNTIVYASLYLAGLLVFISLLDFYRKFED